MLGIGKRNMVVSLLNSLKDWVAPVIGKEKDLQWMKDIQGQSYLLL